MPSVTFKPIVISSNKRKDGTYPVKIRVTYKGVSRRLPTTLIARPSDLTRTLHIKNPDILNKANELIARMQGTLFDLSPFVLEDWDVDKVINHIKSKLKKDTFKLDFFAFADKYLDCKKTTTRRAYDTALGALERFIGKREIDINDITKTMLVEFVEFVNKEPKMAKYKGVWIKCKSKKSAAVSSYHLMKLSHIFNAAKMKYNDDDRILIPRSPFDGIPRDYGTNKGQDALPLEVIQMMIDSDSEGMERIALDAFLVSFGLMGVNMADLYSARSVESLWIYNRQKTRDRRPDKAEMRVTLPDELQPIIARLQDGPKGWLLPSLHQVRSKDVCTAKVNRYLKMWAEKNGLEPFTFGAARKSFGTIGRKVGVEKATIDECLVHIGDYPIADIYIERQWQLLDEANLKVLSFLHF